MKITVIHGPNLNCLGCRDQTYYGKLTLSEINQTLEEKAVKMGIVLETFQSNHEGGIIDYIQRVSGETDGIIINPGAFTHYSYAIRDSLDDCSIPIIEVHLSNIYSRENFRAKSVTAEVCEGQITGLGVYGYLLALEGLYLLIKQNIGGNEWEGY